MASIDERDYRIVKHVAQFKQLTNAHIHEMVFTTASRTPVDTALKRLVNRRYLSRIERRTVGGAQGGSGQYVYQLGKAGHFIFKEGRYSEWKSINYHAIAVADTYLALKRLGIEIAGYSTEPDCHITIAGVELRPDMYVELSRRSFGSKNNATLKLWLEVDLSTEGQKQIRGKLDKYQRAYDGATVDDLPEWPRIYFVCVDEWRVKELKWLLSQLPSQNLFNVILITDIPNVF